MGKLSVMHLTNKPNETDKIKLLQQLMSDCVEVIYHSVDGHVQNSPGTHDVEEAVDVLKDGDHHFIFVFGGRSTNGRVQVV